MAEENKNETTVPQKLSPEDIKKRESELKTAFKEGRLNEIQTMADALKKADPANRLADKLMKKAQEALANQKKKANAEKINELEKQMKIFYKAGQLMDIATVAGEIKKLDPENKAVKEMEKKIDKAKTSMDKQVKKEQIKNATEMAKMMMDVGKWDEAVAKANEILNLDSGSSFGMKVLKKAAKAKNVAIETLIMPASETEKKEEKTEEKKPTEVSMASVPARAEPATVMPASIASEKNVAESPEAKKGFFARWFGKKDKNESQISAGAEMKGSIAAPDQSKKDQVKTLEERLKQVQKDALAPMVKSVIEDLKKLDPMNKAAMKAEEKLEKERLELERKVKEEKIKGMSKELKTQFENGELEKAKKTVEELLLIDNGNRTALKMKKKIDEKISLPKMASVESANKEKKGLFSGLFSKKEKENTEVIVEKSGSEELKSEKEEGDTSVSPAQMPVADMPKAQAPVMTYPAEKKVEEKAVPIQASAVDEVIPEKTADQSTETKKEASPLKSKIFNVVKPIIPIIKVPVENTADEPMVSLPLKKAERQAPAIQSVAMPAGDETAGEGKGNIFTKLFGEGDAKKKNESIIDTIVSQSNEAAQEEKKAKREAKKKPENPGRGFLQFSSLFLKFSAVFIVFSAAFFYIFNIDEQNTVLQMVSGKENNAIMLKSAAEEVDKKNAEQASIQKEIKKYKDGYENEHKKTIQEIVVNRLKWPDLIEQLNEVTESVYEKNALTQYVKYNNYSYDVTSGQLTVSGTLSDPQGRNLTKLAELEEAFKYYPKDKDDPEDATKPYFYNMRGFNSYAKQLNKTTNRYTSSFSLVLSTKEIKKKK